jgi:twitching motility protein PilI
MANREALRELQSRLAERLQLARTEARQAILAGRRMRRPGPAGAAADGRRDLPRWHLLPVPHTQPWFMGVANLRGGLHGVVDLAAFLGLRQRRWPRGLREPGPAAGASTPMWAAHCAVLVDRLAGLRSAGQLTAEPPTTSHARPSPVPAGATPTGRAGRRSTWPRWRARAVSGHRRMKQGPHVHRAYCSGCHRNLSDEEDDMSFLDRIKGSGRARTTATPTPSAPPFDELVAAGQPDGGHGAPGPQHAVAARCPAPHHADSGDSSIISEAAPSELAAEYTETRLPGERRTAEVFTSGLP